MHLNGLHQFVQELYPLKQQEWEAFSTIWQPFTAPRKMVLTKSGETERYLYFVEQGIQRSFYLRGRKEVTIVFTYPPSFSGVADSFLTQTPSNFYFETITESSFLRTSHQQLQQVMHAFPAVQELVLKTTSFVLRGVLQRMAEMQSSNAEEKFRQLTSRSPHLLNLVPHKYLASYLGLDAATFSKLLGTVRI
jgi:CRP-like cAMP-binding protein